MHGHSMLDWFLLGAVCGGALIGVMVLGVLMAHEWVVWLQERQPRGGGRGGRSLADWLRGGAAGDVARAAWMNGDWTFGG